MNKHNISNDKTTKLIFFCLITVVLLVITVFLVNIYNLRKTSNESSTKYLNELSLSVNNSVYSQIENGFKYIESLTYTYRVMKENDNIDFSQLQDRAELFNFIHLFFMDKTGKAHSTDGLTEDYSNNPEILEALKGKKVVAASRATHGDNKNCKEGFTFAVPIYKNGEVIGAAVACTNRVWIDALLSQTYFGGNVYFHIMEKNGDFILKSENPYFTYLLKDKNLYNSDNLFDFYENNAKFSKNSSINKIKEAVENNEKAIISYKYTNEDISRLGQILPIKDTNLYLFMIAVDNATNKAFLDLFDSMFLSYCFVIAIFIILTIVLFSFYRSSTYLAFIDPVTGGFSNTKFKIEAEKKIKNSSPGKYTFIALNIDNFKLINDVYSSEEGDKLLKYVFKIITKHIYNDEIACRFSSDHFNILIHTDTDEKIIQRIDDIINDINSFNSTKYQNYYISITTGIFTINDSNMPIVYIRDRANIARKQKNKFIETKLFSCVFYTEKEREKIKREKEMGNKAELAIANRDFLVYFQPKVNIKTKQIVSAEALVRWKDSERGIIPPNEFIPYFEKNGFIKKLDIYVFEFACIELRKLIDAGKKPITISANLSRAHLDNEDFLVPYIKIQQKYDIPPKYIELELTETMLSKDVNVVINAINKIHKAGFICSIDDFGSGYSSLNLLKDINVDVLKLDKSFLSSPNVDDPRERAIIEEVVHMAGKLGMLTCSEGVETKEQLDFLESIGCDNAQGYFFSRPIELDKFEELLYGEKLDTTFENITLEVDDDSIIPPPPPNKQKV